MPLKTKRAKVHQISVLENLRRIFITNKYTKTLRPLFGLNKFIDKKADIFNLLELKHDIISQISMYEPRIKPTKINFIHENNEVICEIEFLQDDRTQLLRLEV